MNCELVNLSIMLADLLLIPEIVQMFGLHIAGDTKSVSIMLLGQARFDSGVFCDVAVSVFDFDGVNFFELVEKSPTHNAHKSFVFETLSTCPFELDFPCMTGFMASLAQRN